MTEHKKESVKVYEAHSSDCQNRLQFAQRSGVWFERYQYKSPWGYKWSAWRKLNYTPSGHLRESQNKVRLPPMNHEEKAQ